MPAEIGMTNGYPDAEIELANLKRRLQDAEQQLKWCDKPWDDLDGWSKQVSALKAEIALMESRAA
jgi:hypothetical protein